MILNLLASMLDPPRLFSLLPSPFLTPLLIRYIFALAAVLALRKVPAKLHTRLCSSVPVVISCTSAIAAFFTSMSLISVCN